MKKIFCLLTLAALLIISVIPVCAAGTEINVNKTAVKISEKDKSFKFDVNVKSPGKFAGVELGIECSDNLTLSKSTSTAGSMSTPPTEAKGMYWTSFFEGDNKLPEDVTVTLEFTCPENTINSYVLIKEVNILTKDGVGVSTEKLNPNIKVIAGTSQSVIDQAISENNNIGNSGSDSDINDKNDTNNNIIQAEQSNGSSQKSNVADSNSDIAASLKTGQDYNITDTAILLFMIIISLIAVAVLCNYRKYNKKGHNGKYYKH